MVSESNWNISNSEKTLEVLAFGPAFAVGERVIHCIMGAGEVVDIDSDNASYLVKFDDLSTARSISFKADLNKETAEE